MENLVAFSRAVARSEGINKCALFKKKRFFGMSRNKSEFGLGSAIFGISEVDFVPQGLQIKVVVEKVLIFDEKC